VTHVVGVPGLKVSANPGDTLITYALGSCLGVAAYDPVAGVGGLLHVMLPSSALAPEKAGREPCMFVDTGVPLLFRECCRAGARKERLVVKVAGGAGFREDGGTDPFQVGKRNFAAVRQLLRREGVLLCAQDVGGAQPRTMLLEIGTGRVIVRVGGEERIL